MAKTDKKAKKMTANDIFTRSMLFRAIPLSGLKGKVLCDIVMLQVAFDKVVDAFNSRMEEGLKRLKKEKFPKFDEEAQKAETDRCADFAAWEDELKSLYVDMRMAEAQKEVDAPSERFTREMFDAICAVGVDKETVKMPDGDMPVGGLLRALAMIAEE